MRIIRELFYFSSLTLNKNNHLRLIIRKYLKIWVKNNEIEYDYLFCFDTAFRDKKQTWSLFFSDQNEITMRIIGLAMHQVENNLSIYR